jgi:HAE1 family hydrophobic/amphiphilic exporter-1
MLRPAAGNYDLHREQPVLRDPEVSPEFQRDPVALSKLYVRSNLPPRPDGSPTLIPLDAVARLKQDVSPVSVAHYGQLPAVTISFNTAPGVSLGQAVDRIENAMREISLPATITTTFVGRPKLSRNR